MAAVLLSPVLARMRLRLGGIFWPLVCWWWWCFAALGIYLGSGTPWPKVLGGRRLCAVLRWDRSLRGSIGFVRWMGLWPVYLDDLKSPTHLPGGRGYADGVFPRSRLRASLAMTGQAEQTHVGYGLERATGGGWSGNDGSGGAAAMTPGGDDASPRRLSVEAHHRECADRVGSNGWACESALDMLPSSAMGCRCAGHRRIR